MLRRPTGRRRGASGEIELNLVPMLDALVTMIAFLMFSMSFLGIVTMDSPIPQAGVPQKAPQEKPLQLTVRLKSNEVIISSPFSKISTSRIPHLPDGAIDTFAVHNTLVKVKEKHPYERQVVFIPHSGATYDEIISLVDHVRVLFASDPSIYRRNKDTGIDERVSLLFPDVVFGNLLGD